MATLTGELISETYDSLLKVGDNQTITGVKKRITDGFGNSIPLLLSSTDLEVDGNFLLSALANATTDTDKFLVLDTTTVKYRTGSQMRTDIGAGTVNSVGLSMPSAFSVANSPITDSGVLEVTAIGLASQYIRGNGTLADFPTSGGGGGSSVSYYLNGSVNQGTFVGNVYKEMNKTPILGAGTDFTINANGYIAQFITDATDPGALLIPAGNWDFETYFSASSGGGSPSFYIELYKYNGSAFTLIASNSTVPELISFGTSIQPYFSSIAVPETVLTVTDRLAIRVYVTHSGRTITLHTEDNHLCEVQTTFTTGLQSLNGLTKQAQYFAVGSTGTDFNISSSVDTHTFNIPSASATARGVVTTGTQTFAGEKTFTASRTIFQNSDFAQITFKNTSDLTKTLNIGYGSNGNIFSSNGLDFRVGGLTSSALLITANENATFKENLTAKSFIKSGGTSSQFLKADGSVDTTTYQGAISLGAIGITPNANAASLVGSILNLQPADASFGGVVTTGTQTFAGDKTLTGSLYGIGLSMTGTSGDIIGSVATTGKALRGTATTGFGVYASSTTGQAIYAESTGTGGSAVNGTAANGIGGYFFNNSTTFATLYVSNFGSGNLANFSNSAGTKFTINNAGNLGNGTYTYTLPSATGTLALTSDLSAYLPLTGGTLSNNLTISASTGNSPLRFTSTTASSKTGYLYADATTIGICDVLNGGAGVGGIFFNSTTKEALILNNGSVSLSIASTGAATFSSTGTANSIFIGGISASGGYGVVSLNGTNAEGQYIGIAGGGTGGTDKALYYQSGNGGSHIFRTGDGTSYTERMRITSGGNVGIGTTSPTQKLHLYGSGANTQSILLESSIANANAYVIMKNTGKSYITGLSYDIGPNNYLIYDETAAATRLAITSGGNVLIGTTTDNGAKLQVQGSGLVATFNDTTSGDETIRFLANGTFRGGLGADSVSALKITGTGGIVALVNTVTGIYTPTSDVNKKKDFEDSKLGLNAILGLKPTLYRMKSEQNTPKNLGFIAQEVREFIPQAYVESGSFIGLTEMPIIATLVKAIQELKAEIDILKNN
jgi:hypothetical protein